MAPSTRRAKNKKPEKVDVSEEDKNPGVVYIGHVPHGFFEEQMISYFKQFGDVMAIKLSRSKKSGKSKGFAFIKFRYAAVAKTVAETCHNYLFFNRLLKCAYRPMSDVHIDTFKSHPEVPLKKDLNRHNAHKSEVDLHKSKRKATKKLNKKMKIFSEAGVNIALDDILSISQDSGKKSQKPMVKQSLSPMVKTPKGRKRGRPEDNSSEEVAAKNALETGAVPTPKRQKKSDSPKTEKTDVTAMPTPKRQKKSDSPKTEKTNITVTAVSTPKRQKKSDSPKIEKSKEVKLNVKPAKGKAVQNGSISPQTKLVKDSPSGKETGRRSGRNAKKSPGKVAVPIGVKQSSTGRKKK